MVRAELERAAAARAETLRNAVLAQIVKGLRVADELSSGAVRA